MRVAFVTTANAGIGTGHLRRCLTLAAAMADAGASARFLIYAADEQVRAWIEPWGELSRVDSAMTLQEAIEQSRRDDLVVVDTYDVSAGDLLPLQHEGVRVLAIDDLADRPLLATWLLNVCVTDPVCYRTLTSATLLLGPAHALLRRQFAGLPARRTRAAARRILVSFGGSDPLGMTARALRALDDVPGPLEVRVVAGLLAGGELPACPRHRVEVLRDVADMATLMQWADVAVAAAGQTIFELAAAGCPAICLLVADNQERNGVLFANIGSAVVRDGRAIRDDELADELRALTGGAARREAMSLVGQAAVDGRGAERVVKAVTASNRQAA